MPRQSKSDRWAKVHQNALLTFDDIQAATWDDRQQSLQDRRFAALPGAQTEGLLVNPSEERVHLEVNKVAGAVTRLKGEFRNNRHTVDFLPRDGSERDDLAEAMNGMFRADWQDSVGDEAADRAIGDGITGGFGAFRLCARLDNENDDYEDDDNERQRVVFEPIVDADVSVFWDLDCKRQDKLDAEHCGVVTAMTHARYKETWGDDPASWPKEMWTSPYGWDWCRPDVVYVMEWFKVEKRPHTMLTIVNRVTGEEVEIEKPKDDDDEGQAELRELLAIGGEIVEEKKKKKRVIKKYTMNGMRVLAEEVIPGRYIPIANFYGVHEFIDDKERWSGIVRVTKDAQRLFNMLTSLLAETAAFNTPEVPILNAEQVNPYKVEWDERISRPRSYLRLATLTGADGAPVAMGPIGYTKPQSLPEPLAALLQFVGADLRELLGNAQNAEEMVSNISGKAVELIQQKLDSQTYIYLDNFKKTMQSAGIIWKFMSKDIYVESGRKMKTIGPDGRARGQVVIGEPGVTPEGIVKRRGLVDLSRADHDVVVDVGPSTATKRTKTVRELTSLMAVTPPNDTEMQSTLMLGALMNMEGEGLGDFREWARMRLVKMGVVKPTPDEQKKLEAEAQNQKPDMQGEVLKAEAMRLQVETQRAAALADKAVADTALAQAKTAETEAQTGLKRAQTVETLAKADNADRQANQSPGLVFVNRPQ